MATSRSPLSPPAPLPPPAESVGQEAGERPSAVACSLSRVRDVLPPRLLPPGPRHAARPGAPRCLARGAPGRPLVEPSSTGSRGGVSARVKVCRATFQRRTIHFFLIFFEGFKLSAPVFSKNCLFPLYQPLNACCKVTPLIPLIVVVYFRTAKSAHKFCGLTHKKPIKNLVTLVGKVCRTLMAHPARACGRPDGS